MEHTVDVEKQLAEAKKKQSAEVRVWTSVDHRACIGHPSAVPVVLTQHEPASSPLRPPSFTTILYSQVEAIRKKMTTEREWAEKAAEKAAEEAAEEAAENAAEKAATKGC